jgi:hypothetical protein
MARFPESTQPGYEVFIVSGTQPVVVKRRSGSTPTVLIGVANHASTNQAAGIALSDINGDDALLPQIGLLSATQSVEFVNPGIPLYHGLIATPLGAVSRIALYIR